MSRPEEFLTRGDHGGPMPGRFLPSGVSLLPASQQTNWVRENVLPFGQAGEGTKLHSVLPNSFPDYARILHPGHMAGTHAPIRWSEVAHRTGRTMHPLAQWGRISTSGGLVGPGLAGVIEPEPGRLSEEVVRYLVAALRQHTGTPERCALGIWEGYGSIADQYPSTPRLGLPDRTYLVFEGPIEAMVEFVEGGHAPPPNLWWPEDRAWCVATEIDFHETYVGGTRACVDAILAHPELETFRVPAGARVDLFADTINA